MVLSLFDFCYCTVKLRGGFNLVVTKPKKNDTDITEHKKKKCLDRGSNTGPLDLQSNALPTELSKQHGERTGAMNTRPKLASACTRVSER